MYHWPSFFSFQDPRGRQGSPRVPYSQTGTSINGRARSSDIAMGHRISVTEVVVWNRIGYLLRFSESRVHSMQPAARESLPPRIEDGFDRKLKICGVARDQREAVDLRVRCNEPIYCLDWPSARLVPCHQSPPFIRDGTVDQGDSPLESLREFAAHPRVKVPAPTACRQPLDAVTQLCEGDDA